MNMDTVIPTQPLFVVKFKGLASGYRTHSPCYMLLQEFAINEQVLQTV
jgi:hypothetical protein